MPTFGSPKCRKNPFHLALDKEARLLACSGEAARDPRAVALVFIDEMGYYRWPDTTTVWSPRAPQPLMVTDPAGPNNRQWRVIGALHAVTGQVS